MMVIQIVCVAQASPKISTISTEHAQELRLDNEFTNHAITDFEIIHGPCDAKFINVFRLIKHAIHTHRDVPLDPELLRYRVTKRIEDMGTINWRKVKEKELRLIKRNVLL